VKDVLAIKNCAYYIKIQSKVTANIIIGVVQLLQSPNFVITIALWKVAHIITL
jgi:hypothetical protein